MEKYSSRTIDEAGRLRLPSEIIRRLNFAPGDKFSLKHLDTVVVLQRAEDTPEHDCVHCNLGDLGRITLPAELRQKLNWNNTDRIALYHIDNIIILRLSEEPGTEKVTV